MKDTNDERNIVKINELYQNTKPEAYLEAIEVGEDVKNNLREEERYYPVAPKVINRYWSEYYLLKKYPEMAGPHTKEKLVAEIRDIVEHLSEPTEIFSFLYLWSTAESSLEPYDFKEADRLNALMGKMIEEGKVGLIEMFRFINAKGLKFYGEKDFVNAIKAFKEIEQYPTDPENFDDETKQIAGHAFSNWGMVLVRRGIDPQKGTTLLEKARDLYYMKMSTPPTLHLNGIKNRLREADEKIQK